MDPKITGRVFSQKRIILQAKNARWAQLLLRVLDFKVRHEEIIDWR